MAPRLTLVVVCITLLVASVAPGAAWSPESQVSIALEAARLAPPDFQRQLDKHEKRLKAGAVAPFQGTDASAHYWHHDGAGELDHVAFAEIEGVIEALRSLSPFEEIVHRVGVVSHYVADANNPLNAAGDDPAEARYFADYLRYMESAAPRFALVFYTGEPAVDTERDVRLLLYRALHRGRGLYPLVGAEYRRVGFTSGVNAFDDRSTAFGVAAVSYSHAVSDMARVLRYIWLRAGGAVEPSPLWRHTDGRLLQLPRATGR